MYVFHTGEGRMTRTDTLFAPESASLDHEPSKKLVRRAEAFRNADEGLPKFGGHLMRMAMRRETKGAKIALAIPATVELLLELPTTILPAVVRAHSKRRQFDRAMVREYPHLLSHGLGEHIRPDHDWTTDSSANYANAVLTYGSSEAFTPGSSHQLPPSQPGNPASTELPAPHSAASPSNLTPIVET